MSMFRAFICHGLNTNNLTTWLHSVIYELRKEHYHPNSFIGPGSHQTKIPKKSFPRKKLEKIFSSEKEPYLDSLEKFFLVLDSGGNQLFPLG